MAGDGYTRQATASIQPDEDINAEPLNLEFDALDAAFDEISGHSHDGSVGNAPQINLTTSVTGTLPQANGGTGSSDGTISFTTITATTEFVGAKLVNADEVSALNISGGSTSDTGSNIIFYGNAHATLAGDFALRDDVTNIIYYDKSANTTTFSADTVVIPTVDINGGTVDGITLSSASATLTGGTINNMVIGGVTPVAGTFSNLTSTNLDVTGITNISGTIDFSGATVLDLGTVSTIDLNGGTIDGTVIGGATPAAGTFTTGTIATADINGGNIDGTVIGSVSAAAGSFTTLGTSGLATLASITSSGTINFAGATVSNLGTVTTADINGGTIDGTSIGATTPSSVAATTLSASGAFSLSGDQVQISEGGTGSSTASGARSNLSVDATVQTKSTGYTVVAGDRGNLIRCTAAITLSLTAAATLGSDFKFYVKADGATVTIDPNSTETIDGATTATLLDGESATVFCNGTSFFMVKGGSGGGLFKGENGTVGSSAGDIFRVNEQELNTDTTIAATENASCAGPLTVATGVTLTITSGGRLAIV